MTVLRHRGVGVLFLFMALGAISTVPLTAQEGATAKLPTVPADDYGKWENLGGASLSNDGQWIAYAIRTVGDERELRLRAVAAGASERVFAWGENPEFSDDGRWLA